MPLEIDGEIYATTSDVLDAIGVSRQTLWRWRRNGKIPVGRRYRDGQIIFNTEEMDDIKSYANRLIPAEIHSKKRTAFQMKLFDR